MLEVEHLHKSYGGRAVVDDVSLNLQEGQFLSLLGPSGSGKSTVLRMIAGLIRPDSGMVRIDNVVADDNRHHLPPERRAMGMVFQDYALWPHMTVGQNIAFGLRIQHWSRRAIAHRVGEMLELVRLEGLERRFPFQLSGGQQQRVALARSLAPKPKLLLLDEPLSNLDTQLRQMLRDELAVLLRHVGVTSVYVTHDQIEALEMSDVIVLLRDGQMEQVGTPADLYEHPSSLFVETFLGATNVLTGPVERVGSHIGVRVGETVVMGGIAASVNGSAVLCVRPEAIAVVDGLARGQNRLACTLVHSGFVGGRWQHACTLEGARTFQMYTQDALNRAAGDVFTVYLPPERCRILPPDPTVLTAGTILGHSDAPLM